MVASWYSSDYPYRRQITLDGTKISGGHTDFPFLFQVLTPDTNLSSNAHSGGKDFIFTSSDGTTRTHCEIDNWLYGSGNVWVRAPSLTDATDEDFYLYYGEGTDHTSDTGYLPSGVWDSNFVAVWHMKDSSTSVIDDSTAYYNSGNKKGANEPIVTTNGKIGNAQYFDGSNDYIDCGNDSSLDITNTITVGMWVKLNDVYPGNHDRMLEHGTWDDGGFRFIQSYHNTTMNWDIVTDESRNQLLGDSLPTGAWTYVVGTYTTGDKDLYYNGTINKEHGQTGTIVSTLTNLFIGSDTAHGECFKGWLDEIRISNVVRNPGWILTGYRVMSSNSTFLSLGSQERRCNTFDTPVGSPTGFTWTSGQFNVESGMRATTSSATSWEWGAFSSSANYFYPDGSETSWSWSSGNKGV